eukprot:639152-Hanusia_phi.AAC.6
MYFKREDCLRDLDMKRVAKSYDLLRSGGGDGGDDGGSGEGGDDGGSGEGGEGVGGGGGGGNGGGGLCRWSMEAERSLSALQHCIFLISREEESCVYNSMGGWMRL